MKATLPFSAAVFAAVLAVRADVNEAELFGPNVYIFSPKDPIEKIDRTCEEIFRKQHHSQFGTARYALLFKPGDYTASKKPINVGYYTQVLGLGRTPHAVKLSNIKTPCALDKNNATCNFWVGVENFTVVDHEKNEDPYFNFQWAVSQAAPARRLLVERKAVFDWFYGWASGGYVADCVFRKPAGSWSQQQYYYRTSRLEQGAYGVNWNNFAHGCEGPVAESLAKNKDKTFPFAPTARAGVASNWKSGGKDTLVDTVEVIREKPFLYLDGAAYKVFVPALRRNAKGVSWGEGDMGKGRSLDLVKDFFVARADRHDAAAVNAALAKGRHVLFTPGIYHVSEPLRVTKPGTVVLGIGEATIVPENGEAALVCADAPGITVAGLIFDAERASRRFVVVGERKGTARRTDDPILLVDTIYRVGGTGKPGKTEVCLEVNANDVIIDHTWVWRADHGAHTGWTANTARNGIRVNGDGVIGYGLFVEHFQEHDILWNGEDGRTYFLQNEKCYDPPGNAQWMSHGGKKKGYAAYKVADGVRKHYAVGLGVYDVFINTQGNSVWLDDAVEVPDAPGVMIENACIVELAAGDGPKVGINHIVNGRGFGIRTGKGSGGGYAVQRVTRYTNGQFDAQPDYYQKK